jgi:formylmethanofuran dehydrogenase subunit E
MNAQEIMNSEEFKRCESFHGHVCPGLSIGFRAANIAMERLRAMRAEDEELVAVMETDACAADPVQVLTGCTFGKGNFIFKDHGKMALTLFDRRTGEGLRLCMKPDAFPPDETHMALLRKVMGGEASPGERAEFRERHLQRSRDILEAPVEALFDIRSVKTDMPEKAKIQPSRNCARCGEPTMPAKMAETEAGWLCRGCLESE